MTVNNREIGTILTTEQLKKMDGMPVWSDDLGVFGIVNVDAVGMFKDIPFLVGPNFNYDIEKRGLRLYEATCFGHPLERVRELVQADREGRCVVLPCKLGNKVYFPLLGRIIKKTVYSIVTFSNSQRIYCDGTSEFFRPENFGKTVFLTRAAAEKALEEMEID